MITHESLAVGVVLGRHEYRFDGDALRQWLSLFPTDEDGDVMPPGMTAVVAMRAFGAVLTPRAPGNVHASQKFEVERLPLLGETLVTAVSCVEKSLRHDRRRVTILTETSDTSGGVCFRGTMGVIWAS
ncbi:hypothetical protein GXW78_26190 [Roseomonas terrae]|uniref:N-terminal of MaoC-like dehydratase domain-containing protein n=1 Tax=Neoroseomonas terrae TaxID=424799 RepID=A0ABS5EQ67_9PROT|nr:hypothetical protein [Neoroseomonas terrae]MBR0653173.1 hypothetical protein [Neoroseomonas terrae]